MRRRVDQPGAFDQRGQLGEPRRMPEATHFALHLVAGAGAAVVTVEGRRLKKQGAHYLIAFP